MLGKFPDYIYVLGTGEEFLKMAKSREILYFQAV